MKVRTDWAVRGSRRSNKTCEPSSGGIGSKLNNNKTTLISIPTAKTSETMFDADVLSDTVAVSPGGVVVRVYWRGGGPAPMCLGYTTANATVGPNAVQKTTDGSVTSWEIRLPDG